MEYPGLQQVMEIIGFRMRLIGGVRTINRRGAFAVIEELVVTAVIALEETSS